jgi:hypothetical protein
VRRYEIHVRAPAGEALAVALGDAAVPARLLDVPPQTVLVLGPTVQGGLDTVLARLEDLGLELLEIRQRVRTQVTP